MIAASFRILACVTLFTILAAGQSATLTTLKSFGIDDGTPQTGVVIGSNGVLYGTTWRNGGIYSLTPPVSGTGWAYNILYSFPTVQRGSAGYSVTPNNLAIDTNGVLYGTTFSGGSLTGTCGINLVGCGFVYSLTPPAVPGGAWTETTLYTFTGGDDGAAPGAGVTIGPGGVLYGTAEMKGASSLGTAFSLAPPSTPGGSWTEATLHTFAGGADGGAPAANLAIDGDGVLYGTTDYGGAANRGTIFSLTPPASPGGSWTETVIYAFTGGDDGSVPNGGVVIGPGGVLYGSTRYGGFANGGAAYSLTPPALPGGPWTETVLNAFGRGPTYGPFPGPLTFGNNGVLYGTTNHGGARTYEGCVFALMPPASPGSPWTYFVVYKLDQASGTYPSVSFYTGGEILAAGPGGVIYGTATLGGTSNQGTVFALHP